MKANTARARRHSWKLAHRPRLRLCALRGRRTQRARGACARSLVSGGRYGGLAAMVRGGAVAALSARSRPSGATPAGQPIEALCSSMRELAEGNRECWTYEERQDE